MLIFLHKNATTTPAIREAIQKATGSDYVLARHFNVIRDTIHKRRRRDTAQDASRTAHRLQTTLNAGQEELVIYLRTQLLLPLDDLLAVIKEFNRKRTPTSLLKPRHRCPLIPRPTTPVGRFSSRRHTARAFAARRTVTG